MSGFYNDKLAEGLVTGNYYCPECGEKMDFEDDHRDTLICPKCGNDVDLEHYGFDSDEEYDALYPTEEEFEEMNEP